jgi:hypothetical protein
MDPASYLPWSILISPRSKAKAKASMASALLALVVTKGRIFKPSRASCSITGPPMLLASAMIVGFPWRS